jgi:hypothetical protein
MIFMGLQTRFPWNTLLSRAVVQAVMMRAVAVAREAQS